MKKISILSLFLVLLGLLTYFLRQVFSGSLILPQFFYLGPLTTHYYGLIMAVAAVSGYYFAIRRAPKFGFGQKQVDDMLFLVIVGGFLGARLYHVLSSIGYYFRNPIDIFKVWNGGLSIYGAVIGGIITLIFLQRDKARHNLLPKITLRTLDWLVPSLILGQIIGRFGNLFNYEAFGYPTNLPWKMFVPFQFRPEAFAHFDFFHPWFLYELLGNAVILIILLLLEKRQKFFQGGLFFSYLLLYNVLRLALEFIRIDSTFIGAIRLNVLTSLLLCLLAIIGLCVFRRNHVQIS